MPSSMLSGKYGWAGPCWRLELLFGIEAAISVESIINIVFFLHCSRAASKPKSPGAARSPPVTTRTAWDCISSPGWWDTAGGAGATSNFRVAASPLPGGGVGNAGVLIPVGTAPHIPAKPSLLLVALRCPSHCREITHPGDIFSLCFLMDDVDEEKEA